MSWSSVLILKSNEQVVHSWNAILTNYVAVKTVERRKYGRDKVRTAKQIGHRKGVLVLTNQRLLWILRRGRMRKSYHLSNEIHLSKISGLSMGGSLFKYVTISDGERTYQFNVSKVGSKEFEYFKDMILRQKEKLITSSTSQVTKEVITREVVLIPCSYCKGLMPQTSLFCPNCGAQRVVQVT